MSQSLSLAQKLGAVANLVPYVEFDDQAPHLMSYVVWGTDPLMTTVVQSWDRRAGMYFGAHPHFDFMMATINGLYRCGCGGCMDWIHSGVPHMRTLWDKEGPLLDEQSAIQPEGDPKTDVLVLRVSSEWRGAVANRSPYPEEADKEWVLLDQACEQLTVAGVNPRRYAISPYQSKHPVQGWKVVLVGPTMAYNRNLPEMLRENGAACVVSYPSMPVDSSWMNQLLP